MPLSEHEQRVLEQIERSLYADDPKFAASVRGIDPRARARRRYARSAIILVVGVALLPVGIVLGFQQLTYAGVALAAVALLYGVSAWRRTPDRTRERVARRAGVRKTSPRAVRGPHRAAARQQPKRPLMQRFEERWERRRERGYGN